MKRLIIILFLVLTSCVKKYDGSLSQEELNIFKQESINRGDNYSYSRLIVYYGDKDNYYELLPYSFIMANKYKNVDGYFQVYYDLIKINNDGKYEEKLILNLDEETKSFALSNLMKGAMLGDGDCRDFLARHYRQGLGFPKNEKIADSIMSSNH
jgi:hypothetical protein